MVKKSALQKIESHEKLNLSISESEGGAKIIDAGIKTTGCLEAGRIITEICMGGLGTVSLSMTNNTPNWPLSIHVHSTNPVLSCLASQYAGWNLSFVKEEDLKDFEEDVLGETPPNTADAMKRHKAGKAGFTDKAHLKAKGLIPRADGTKKKSDKYK